MRPDSASDAPGSLAAAGQEHASVAKMNAKAAQLRAEMRNLQLQAASSVVRKQGPRSPLSSSGGALLKPGSPPEGTSPNTAATSSTSNTATPLPPPALSLASSSASAAAAAAGASPHNSMVRAVTTANAVSVFQRLAANSKGPGGAGGDTNLALVQQLQELKAKQADMAAEMERRQASYMRREEQLKAQLAAAQQQLDAGARGADGEGEEEGEEDAEGEAGRRQAASVQQVQHQLLDGLDQLLARQRAQMRAEAAQEVRALRRALAEVEGALRGAQEAAAARQGDWSSKTAGLRAELAAAQDIASKLDGLAKAAEEEAAAARVALRAQEDDRQHLIRQALRLKTENKRLRAEVQELHGELDTMVNLALDSGVDHGQGFDREDQYDRSCSPEQLAPLLGAGAMQELQAASTIAAAEAAAANRYELLQGMLRPVSAVAAAAAGVGPGSPKAGAGAAGRPSTSPGRPRSSARQQLQLYQHGGGDGRPRTAAAAGGVRGSSNFSAGDTDTHGWYGAVTTHQDQLSPRQQQQQQQQQQQLVLDPVLVANRMQRYSQVILKLQQLLQSERRTARALRVRYGDELARRTAVQGLLMGQLQSLGEQSRDFEVLVRKLQQLHTAAQQAAAGGPPTPKGCPSPRPRPTTAAATSGGASGLSGIQAFAAAAAAAGAPGSPGAAPGGLHPELAKFRGAFGDAGSSANSSGFLTHRSVTSVASSAASSSHASKRPSTAAASSGRGAAGVGGGAGRPSTAAAGAGRHSSGLRRSCEGSISGSVTTTTSTTTSWCIGRPAAQLSSLAASVLLQPGQEVAHLLLKHVQQLLAVQQGWLQQVLVQGFPELLAELPEAVATDIATAAGTGAGAGAAPSSAAAGQQLGTLLHSIAAAAEAAAATTAAAAGGQEAGVGAAPQLQQQQQQQQHLAALAAANSCRASAAAQVKPAFDQHQQQQQEAGQQGATEAASAAAAAAAAGDAGVSSQEAAAGGAAASSSSGPQQPAASTAAAGPPAAAAAGGGGVIDLSKVTPPMLPSFPVRPSSSSTQQRAKLMQQRSMSASTSGGGGSSSGHRPGTAVGAARLGGVGVTSPRGHPVTAASATGVTPGSPGARPATAAARMGSNTAAAAAGSTVRGSTGGSVPNAAALPAARPWRMNTQQLMVDFLSSNSPS